MSPTVTPNVPGTIRADPICDLVLLSWNQWEQTGPCLETLFQNTIIPSRLFIVDNASEQPVRAFLSDVKPQGAILEVRLLQNEKNEGFPKGMNRGIQESTAPFVCLLNNDLRFTKGWLKELLDIARSNPTIGVLNPSSSTFGKIPPRGVSLQEYAESLQSRHGQFTEVGMCIGFCMLIKREVLTRIGRLTEEVERIFFEDEDFCMRVQAAGYQCVVAEASYVYHAEHKTVRHMPEREALFERNQRWCHKKWGRWLRVAWPQVRPLVPHSEPLRQWLQQVLELVKNRTYVYVYCPVSVSLTKEAAFRSVNLTVHADVHWHRIAGFLPSWIATGWILKRQKKHFDIIIAPTVRWQKILEFLRWRHRAHVILEGDSHRLQELMSLLRGPVKEQRMP